MSEVLEGLDLDDAQVGTDSTDQLDPAIVVRPRMVTSPTPPRFSPDGAHPTPVHPVGYRQRRLRGIRPLLPIRHHVVNPTALRTTGDFDGRGIAPSGTEFT